MGTRRENEKANALRARRVGGLLAVTMVVWMAAQWLGGQYDLAPRFVFLIDLAALAAFAYALVNIFWLWRARREEEG